MTSFKMADWQVTMVAHMHIRTYVRMYIHLVYVRMLSHVIVMSPVLTCECSLHVHPSQAPTYTGSHVHTYIAT